jgi:hypothetical protein
MRGFAINFTLSVFLGLVFVYIPFLHHTEPTEIGIARNLFTGEVYPDTPGWNVTAPWVAVAKVDVRPMRVCVTSAGRGFGCKLVQFRKEAYREFVRTEGFYYYWWANRFSINLGYREEYRGVKDLLRGYAYGVVPYPFLAILREYRADEN